MKFLSVIFLSLLCLSSLQAQDVWQPVNEVDIIVKARGEREIVPEAYGTFLLDFKKMTKRLAKAPLESATAKSSTIKLSLPLPGGKIEEFRFFESPCMSPGLAAKYPQIKSFRAISNENTGHHARVDYGTMGFHAVVYTTNGTVYIDPYYTHSEDYYISYYTRDHKVDASEYSATCGTDYHEDQISIDKGLLKDKINERSHKSAGEEVIKKTYRLAVTTTGEWGSRYGTVENVLSRIVTGVNRLNMIFENEIATFFELIDRNDELIFLDPATDPFESPRQGRVLVGENSFVINNIIGNAAYDVGHVLTERCTDGVAGIAALGSACLVNKGNGVSCVGGSNISAFVVNTTAHEIGHQFNGTHSWNNCPNAQGQRTLGTAWEPGSGSTILSYAGVCGSQNIVGTNDDYFHVGNLDQFLRFIETTGRCAEDTPSGNHAPEIGDVFGDGLFIPIATPFELDATATDEDGDFLTYHWEQMDTGPISPVGEPTGNSASFRSFPPSPESKRVFPRIAAIVGGIGSNVEVLPLYSRDLTFRFTVKDNHPGAGMTVWEEIKFRASDSAGPFRITAPNSLTFVEVADEMLVEWDVANTDNDIINCQAVDIYFSTNNGDSFEYLLKENTPNDGSEIIEIPNILTNEGKIKVKARDNIFFQLNRSNIIVREQSEPGFYINLEQNTYEACLPDPVSIELSSTAFQSFDDPVELDILDAPEGITYSFSNNPMQADGNNILNIEFDGYSTTQQLDLTIIAYSENTDTLYRDISLNLTGTDFSDLDLIAPDSGLRNVNEIPFFSWNASENAETYTLEIATSPSFGEHTVVRESFLLDTTFIPQVILDNSQLYYWRVVANNNCKASASPVRTLGTSTLLCRDYTADNLPRNISFSGNVTVEGIVQVFDIGEVADLNINSIKGQHSDVLQLTGTLVSPSGTELVLFDQECFGATDLNIGFDDESPRSFMCPLNSGIIMKPKNEELSIFDGESIDGDWIFRLEDNQSGDGGQLSEFELELCANFDIDNPYVINNNGLEVPRSSSARLRNEQLLIADDNNNAEELLYTIIEAPHSGFISLEGEELNVGGQFTQAQLNNGLIRYNHTGLTDTLDSFIFTVIDNEGGWLDMTEFEILVDADVISSSNEIEETYSFKVYPNPARDNLYINSNSNSENWQLLMYDLKGRIVKSDKMIRNKLLDVSDLENGLYILRISNRKSSKSIKLSIAR